MKSDIATRQDIEALVRSFYLKATTDAVIGHFFTTVVHIDWDAHIPLLVDFWESVLLKGTSYRRDPMAVHQRLNDLSTMRPEHFKRWVELFTATVDEHFTGMVAELAKQRATSIATVMRIKMGSS